MKDTNQSKSPRHGKDTENGTFSEAIIKVVL